MGPFSGGTMGGAHRFECVKVFEYLNIFKMGPLFIMSPIFLNTKFRFPSTVESIVIELGCRFHNEFSTISAASIEFHLFSNVRPISIRPRYHLTFRRTIDFLRLLTNP